MGIPPPHWRGPAIAFQCWIGMLRRWGVADKGIEHPWSVCAVKGVKDSGWTQQPFLTTPERTWAETGALDKGSITFETKEGDVLGP